MKILLLSLGVFLIGNTLVAKDSSTAVTLPSGLLVVHEMPSFSKWTVEYTYKGKVQSKGASATLHEWRTLASHDKEVASAMADPRFVNSLTSLRLVRTTVAKTGPLRNEERVFERGFKGELWSDSQFSLEQKPNASAPIVSVQAPAVNREFAEFDWISKESFSGIESRNGHKCLVFRGHVALSDILHPELVNKGAPAEGPTVEAVAYVDMATRDPVCLQLGDDTRVYKILPAPSAMLVLPANFVAAEKDALSRVTGNSAGFSPP